MGSQIFLCLWLFSLSFFSVKANNVFSLDVISKQGIDFRDLADKVRLDNVTNVSPKCIEQIMALWDNNHQALFQMADAWSKFPYAGALYHASKSDWGNYDECVKVEAQYNNERILGKYCAWGWIVPLSVAEQDTSYYLLSYCVPHACSAYDLGNITHIPIFTDTYCSTKDTDSELDNGAIIVIVIFAILFLFAVLSTCYDIYLYYAQKKSPTPIFVAFSMMSNGKRLLQITRRSHAGDQVLCFHGMKFISMWWIISGHGAISWFLAPIDDRDYRDNWQSYRYAKYMTTAHITVDTFFFISGFLMAYLYFKQEISKQPLLKQVVQIPSLILHRYLRLTPANAMCFLGSVFLLKYLQDGPFFSFGIRTGLVEPCKKYWWTYFLYIQNYYNFQLGDSLCIPTTWYLSADFQLFIIAPFVIMPISLLYRRSFGLTMGALLGVNLVSLVIPIFARLQWRDYDPTFQEYDFHSKLISYFMGVTLGIYIRHEKNKKIVINNVLNLVLWALALANMLAVMIYRDEIQIRNEYVSRSLCYSFTRPMWCLSLAWITYACVNGYGGIVNWFLSSSFMQLGGKLTYCLYIVHGMVIAHYSLGIKSRLYFSDWHIFYQNCGYFIISMLIATFWSLSYEFPMIVIERLIFGTGKPAITKPKVHHTEETNAHKRT